SAPTDRVRRKRERERHPVRLAERLTVAQDSVVPRRRLDREPHGFEPADELAHVLPHLGPGVRTRTSLPTSTAAGTACVAASPLYVAASAIYVHACARGTRNDCGVSPDQCDSYAICGRRRHPEFAAF